MDRETTRVIKKFAKKIEKKFAPKSIILFGSRARGDNFKESDYDVIIVSNKFNETHFLDRMGQVYAFWDNKYNLEPLCYTEEEFSRKANQQGIVKKAVKEGIKIY